MVDTQDDLRWKARGAFVLGALVTLGAVYLSVTDLPPTKVAHGRTWLVSIALLLALLCCLVGVLDRHLIKKAPTSRPLPTAAQRSTGLVLSVVQALALLVLGTAELAGGRTGPGAMSLAAGAGFVVLALVVARQPTSS